MNDARIVKSLTKAFESDYNALNAGRFSVTDVPEACVIVSVMTQLRLKFDGYFIHGINCRNFIHSQHKLGTVRSIPYREVSYYLLREEGIPSSLTSLCSNQWEAGHLEDERRKSSSEAKRLPQKIRRLPFLLNWQSLVSSLATSTMKYLMLPRLSRFLHLPLSVSLS
jgi:hypothetical protein